MWMVIGRIISCLLVAHSLYAQAIETGYMVYSASEMAEHKGRWKESMKSNPANIQDPTYQMQRALLTVSGDDTDYIPKVKSAGEIFNDGDVTYQLMHNGIKIVANSYYDTQWMTDVIYGLKGHHEPQEEKCFYEILKYMPEHATMIELGSYWAYYSLWFAHDVKHPTNYLIEPDAHRLAVGKRNFELNNKTGIFLRAFVGMLEDQEPDVRDGVEQIAINHFIARERIEHVNILHADIQGAEVSMLATTVSCLDKIDYFFISTHGPRNHKLCLEFFAEYQLIIVAEHVDAESCSGDGLIVAKRKGVVGPDHIAIRKY